MIKNFNKAKADLIIAIFLLAFEGFLWKVNSEIPVKAGFYPKYLLLFSFVLTILLLIKSIMVIKSKKEMESTQSKGDYKYVLFLIIITVVYLCLINYIGYGISTALYIAYLMWILGVRKITNLIIVPLLTTITLYYIFNNLLMVLLPKGIFFGG